MQRRTNEQRTNKLFYIFADNYGKYKLLIFSVTNPNNGYISCSTSLR